MGAAAGKPPLGQQTGGGHGAAMGREKITAGKKEAARVGNVTTPGEWRETLGYSRPPEWDPIPMEWSGRWGVVRPP